MNRTPPFIIILNNFAEKVWLASLALFAYVSIYYILKCLVSWLQSKHLCNLWNKATHAWAQFQIYWKSLVVYLIMFSLYQYTNYNTSVNKCHYLYILYDTSLCSQKHSQMSFIAIKVKIYYIMSNTKTRLKRKVHCKHLLFVRNYMSHINDLVGFWALNFWWSKKQYFKWSIVIPFAMLFYVRSTINILQRLWTMNCIMLLRNSHTCNIIITWAVTTQKSTLKRNGSSLTFILENIQHVTWLFCTVLNYFIKALFYSVRLCTLYMG